MKATHPQPLLLSLLGGLLLAPFPWNAHSQIGPRPDPSVNEWDNTESAVWPREFLRVAIPSSADGSPQAAYFLSAPPGSPQPLLVSLHTWSADYSKRDRLAPLAAAAHWNFIRPDFRGPNRTADACLSDKAIADIDDAIQHAIEYGNVDPGNIFVVGTSGGGYATLGAYMRTRHCVRAFLAWVPISDLSAWYHQSLNRNPRYSRDILACTSSGSQVLNEAAARARSPLFWDPPAEPNGILRIYAGINDGHTGSVPISHSLLFYNHLARHPRIQQESVSPDEMVQLLTRGLPYPQNNDMLGDRRVLFSRGGESLRLTIFDGGHEMLVAYSFEKMRELARTRP